MREGHQVNDGHGSRYGVDLAEAISVSWVWYIIQGFFILMTITLTSSVYESIETESIFASMIVESWQQATMRFTIMSVLVGMVFFPVYEYIYFRFFSVVIKFYTELFKISASEDQIEECVQMSLVGNTFYLIPIIGRMISFFSTGIYLFAGLRNNIGMSNLQCIITISSPLIFLLMSTGLFFTLLIMMVGVMF